MAVKQNNTEGNGGASNEVNQVKTGSGGVGAGTDAGANGGVGTGAKSKKMNSPNMAGMHLSSDDDVGVNGAAITGNTLINKAESSGCGNVIKNSNKLNIGNDEGSGGGDMCDQGGLDCSVGAKVIKSHLKGTIGDGEAGGGSSSDGAGAICLADESSLSQILLVIDILENGQQHSMVDNKSNDMIKIYQHLIIHLAHVPDPRQTPDELKQFKEDIAKIGAFFAKPNDEAIYRYYLHLVFQLIAIGFDPAGGGGNGGSSVGSSIGSSHHSSPSYALAIIFQLFKTDTIRASVQELLEHNVTDKNIWKTVNVLCEWLRICNFCQNLSLWILAILDTIEQTKKRALFVHIALDNIEQLFTSLIVPVLRPKVAPIVLHMLNGVEQTPAVFHKIIPKFPRVIEILKKQQADSLEPQLANSAKLVLSQLIELVECLMEHFYGYEDTYKSIKHAIKDAQLSMRPVNKMLPEIRNANSDHTSNNINSNHEHNYNRTPSTCYIICNTTNTITTTTATERDATEAEAGGGWGRGSGSGAGVRVFEAVSTGNRKVGLINVGNTCYVNSVLQALVMTTEFSREMLLVETKSPLFIKMQRQIAIMLYSIRHEITPTNILNATRPPGFLPGLQQDSSEFLGYLLETLHEEELAYRKHKPGMLTQKELVANDDSNNQEYNDNNNDEQNIKSMIVQESTVHNENHEGGAPSLHNYNPHEQQQQPTVAATCTTVIENVNDDGDEGYVGESDILMESIRSINTNIVAKTSPLPLTPPLTPPKSQPSSPSLPSLPTTPTKEARDAATPEEAVKVVATANNQQYGLSTIEKTFTGKMATTYKCLTCGWRSRNDDTFRDLQLSFPDAENDCASNYSVQDLIEFYCSPEKLDGNNQYSCPKCNKLSDAERFINVISAPKNLILTLKHFKYDNKFHMRAKLMHKVFHDEKITVKVCSDDTLEEISTAHYDLYAGVVHTGFSMDSGHYYTYAADSANKWYKFNDNSVTLSRAEELHHLNPPNTPYILFYQMGACSTETTLSSHQASSTSTIVTKIDAPVPLTLDELPHELREFVRQDNYSYTEELKFSRRYKNAKLNVMQHCMQPKQLRNYFRTHDDDDDEYQPPGGGGGGSGGGSAAGGGGGSGSCGTNAMNINMNRFIF